MPLHTDFEFEVLVADQGTTRTVTPVGEIDAATVPAARRPLNAALTDGFETIVLDLGRTTFMDSTGVHLVLEAASHARTRGTRLIVLPGPPAVQRVFELCGLSDLVLS